MSKAPLEHINVYTRRNVRDPIEWKLIEDKRNEGYEYIGTIGTLKDSMLNPSTCPLYAVFRRTEMLASPSDAETIKKLKGEIQGLKMKLGRLKKKETVSAGV